MKPVERPLIREKPRGKRAVTGSVERSRTRLGLLKVSLERTDGNVLLNSTRKPWFPQRLTRYIEDY
jgi:hypothetical protein